MPEPLDCVPSPADCWPGTPRTDSIQKRADGMCATLLAEVAARVASGEQLEREQQAEPGEVSRWLSPDERRQAEQLVASGEVRRRYLAAADD